MNTSIGPICCVRMRPKATFFFLSPHTWVLLTCKGWFGALQIALGHNQAKDASDECTSPCAGLLAFIMRLAPWETCCPVVRMVDVTVAWLPPTTKTQKDHNERQATLRQNSHHFSRLALTLPLACHFEGRVYTSTAAMHAPWKDNVDSEGWRGGVGGHPKL